MTSLEDRIRNKLQQQRTRWVYNTRDMRTDERARNEWAMSDIGACQRAIHAALEVNDDATVRAIADALHPENTPTNGGAT